MSPEGSGPVPDNGPENSLENTEIMAEERPFLTWEDIVENPISAKAELMYAEAAIEKVGDHPQSPIFEEDERARRNVDFFTDWRNLADYTENPEELKNDIEGMLSMWSGVIEEATVKRLEDKRAEIIDLRIDFHDLPEGTQKAARRIFPTLDERLPKLAITSSRHRRGGRSVAGETYDINFSLIETVSIDTITKMLVELERLEMTTDDRYIIRHYFEKVRNKLFEAEAPDQAFVIIDDFVAPLDNDPVALDSILTYYGTERQLIGRNPENQGTPKAEGFRILRRTILFILDAMRQDVEKEQAA